MEDILQLPRTPAQRWVFITDESPQNTKLWQHKLNGDHKSNGHAYPLSIYRPVQLEHDLPLSQ